MPENGFYGFPCAQTEPARDFKASGTPGATAGADLAGGTTSGAPTRGYHKAGEFIVDQAAGTIWICTATGAPGTWVLANDPTTSEGDVIYRHAGALARLAVGSTSGHALLSNATDPYWGDAAASGPTRWEPVCDTSGSVLVNAAGDPIMALASTS